MHRRLINLIYHFFIAKWVFMPYWYNQMLNGIKTVIVLRRLQISEARCRLYHIKRMLVARRHYKSLAESTRLASGISGLGFAWLRVLANTWHRERLKEIIIYIIDGLRERNEKPALFCGAYTSTHTFAFSRITSHRCTPVSFVWSRLRTRHAQHPILVQLHAIHQNYFIFSDQLLKYSNKDNK